MSKQNHTDRAHAKLSASGSSRWLNCPGSVQAEEGYPDTSSTDAQLGTLAHELADLCLKENKDAKKYIGKKISVWNEETVKQEISNIIDADMAKYVQEYIDYIRGFENKTSQMIHEETVDFSHVVPDGFGTLDCSVIDFEKRILHLFDLKFGKGIVVYAEDNTQAQLYALGMLNELEFVADDIDEIHIHIVQPRIQNYSHWVITKKDLKKFAKYASERAQLALSGKGKRIPGEKQCQWCKAKADCPALFEFTQEVISMEFDDLDQLEKMDKAVTKLSNKDKRKILDNQSLVESFFKAVRERVQESLEKGGKFEGYKLVRGRSNRVLVDGGEKKLVKKIGKEKAYKQVLIGIGDIEKLCDKEFVEKITFKPEGSLTLAQSSDKREAVKVTPIENEFEDLTDL